MKYLVHALYDSVANTIAVYVNGTLWGSASSVGAYQSAGFPITVGRNPAYSGDYWGGVAQDLAIYPALLTSTQISAHVAAAATGWVAV